MLTVTRIAALRLLGEKWRRERAAVGLVPTMGYLHHGHLALIGRARRAIGKNGVIVVSIYVNPAQFGAGEDLSDYPRDLARDQELCRAAGVQVLFAPQDREIYPGKEAGAYSTYVVEESLSRGMEGVARPSHFRGVTTIVAKLFNLVQPGIAVFGAKDFQQAAIVSRMVRDLNFNVKILIAPTVREPDGLAMSSRNKYLEGKFRRQATVLWQTILKARQLLRQSAKPMESARLKTVLQQFIERQPEARIDYIEIFDPATLQPQSKVAKGSHLALAVFIGKTRLIDNARL
jgi:pantoate--beta-alanine ligase